MQHGLLGLEGSINASKDYPTTDVDLSILTERTKSVLFVLGMYSYMPYAVPNGCFGHQHFLGPM
jgi:hypothetical protein